MTDVDERLRKSREFLDQGQARQSYQELNRLFTATPEALEDRHPFTQAVGLLAELTRSFGGGELSQKLGQVALLPDSVEGLYEAAYQLYEECQYAPAACLLTRANRLAPGQPELVSELVANLHGLMLYARAAEVLDQSGTCQNEAVCAYLSGYSRMMSGDIQGARERLELLAGELPPQVSAMRDALAGMVARAEALEGADIPLGERSLTAWQSVISGTLLLHESPDGYEDAMRGRYCFVQDSPGLMKTGLERLQAILPLVGFAPDRVLSAPGRQSQVLARATARLLGLPFMDWQAGLEHTGLVVAWSLESVQDESFWRALHQHHPGARLFVHASCWTEPFGYSPDFTTLLYQHITDPWTGGALRMDPETGQLGPAPPDERDSESLAAEVLRAEPEQSASSPQLLKAVAVALQSLDTEHHPGFLRNHGLRLRQRAGNPVLSNHF
ncbi:hypothetical protein JST97_02955 [bacterium]|nr:hypothetical protein [bacterium]